MSVRGVRGRLQAGAVQVALNTVAGTAFALLAMTRFRTAGLACVAVALAGLVWLRRDDALAVAAKALAAAAVLADYWRAGPPQTVALVVAGVLVVLLVANMPVLATIADRPVTEAAHLSGYHYRRDLLVPVGVLDTATLGLIAVGAVFAVAAWPVWPFLALAAALALVAGVVGAQALRLRLRPRPRHAVREAVEAYAPAFALHFSAPDDTEYHVEMWRPYLERIGVRWMIVTREPGPFRALAGAPGGARVPVLYCPQMEHLDDVVVPSLRAVFYVNNGMKNTHVVRYAALTHIHLGHGDSEKPAGYNPVTAMYDRIFVPGQAAIDRYAAHGVTIDRQKFDIVGRPQVEAVEVSRRPVHDVADKTVLYASTWTSHHADGNHCSLPIGEAIVAGLLARGAAVILRPHPYAARFPDSARQLARIEHLLAEDRARGGRPHLFGAAVARMSLADCVNAADAQVCDVSGVMTEALFSGKPLAITDMTGAGPTALAASFPLSRAAYVIDRDAADLGRVLDDLLEHDPMAADRHRMRAYYLGDFDDRAYAEAFLSRARSFVGG